MVSRLLSNLSFSDFCCKEHGCLALENLKTKYEKPDSIYRINRNLYILFYSYTSSTDPHSPIKLLQVDLELIDCLFNSQAEWLSNQFSTNSKDRHLSAFDLGNPQNEKGFSEDYKMYAMYCPLKHEVIESLKLPLAFPLEMEVSGSF